MKIDEKMKMKRKEENPVAWSDLVYDMQGEFMAQLNPFDRIRFRAVCKNWLLTEENHRIEDKLPWLFTFKWVENTNNSSTELLFTLYDPIHCNSYLQVDGIQAIMENDPYITMSKYLHVTSKHGWVLFSFDRKYSTKFFLISPLTKQIIKLPHLTNDRTTQIPKKFITFSTPPNSADCVFFVVRDYEVNKKVTISTYRPALYQNSDDTWINNVFYYNKVRKSIRAVYADTKGILHLVSDSGRLAIYIDEGRGLISKGGRILNLRETGHLLESNGDLLLVDINTMDLDSRKEEPRVFKYDWVSTSWVHVNSLRDQALFIGTHNSFAVKSDVGDDQTRNIANKIHYIGGNQYMSQPFVYQLEDEIGSGKLQTTYNTHCRYYSYISNEICRNPNMIWIEPPLHLFNK